MEVISEMVSTIFLNILFLQSSHEQTNLHPNNIYFASRFSCGVEDVTAIDG